MRKSQGSQKKKKNHLCVEDCVFVLCIDPPLVTQQRIPDTSATRVTFDQQTQTLIKKKKKKKGLLKCTHVNQEKVCNSLNE